MIWENLLNRALASELNQLLLVFDEVVQQLASCVEHDEEVIGDPDTLDLLLTLLHGELDIRLRRVLYHVESNLSFGKHCCPQLIHADLLD